MDVSTPWMDGCSSGRSVTTCSAGRAEFDDPDGGTLFLQ